jgi:prepilin peptidase CpaA
MAVWASTLWNAYPPLQWGIAICSSLVAAHTDIRSRRIPNWLTLPLLLGGLAWSGYWAGFTGLADAGAACLALMVPFVLLFLLAGGGAGDAKLMGALGAWLGLVNGLALLAAVIFAGLAVALTVSLAGGNLAKTLRNVWDIMIVFLVRVLSLGRLNAPVELPVSKDMKRIPYGVAIFIGTILAATGVSIWRTH